MKALVIFHDHEADGHPLSFLLRKGFKHCFTAVQTGEYWLTIDGQRGVPAVKVLTAGDFDLAGYYRDCGLTVIETEQNDKPIRSPFILANCVGLVKATLCVRSLAVTPFQLFKSLSKESRP